MIADAARSPSHADKESLYRLTAVEGWCATKLAPTLNVRVEEVEAARQVTESVLQRAEPNRWPAESRVDMAQALATERMDFLYSEAMQAWRESKKLPASDNKSPRGGQPRYLTTAMRIAERIALFSQRMYAAGQMLKLRMERAAKGTASNVTEPGQIPLVRDCSPAKAEQPSPACQLPTASSVSTSHKTPSVNRNPKRSAFLAPLADEFRPVQSQQPGGIGGGRETGARSQESEAESREKQSVHAG